MKAFGLARINSSASAERMALNHDSVLCGGNLPDAGLPDCAWLSFTVRSYRMAAFGFFPAAQNLFNLAERGLVATGAAHEGLAHGLPPRCKRRSAAVTDGK